MNFKVSFINYSTVNVAIKSLFMLGVKFFLACVGFVFRFCFKMMDF